MWLTAQAGSLKENQSGANGSASFTVPAGTYSLKLKKGGMLYQEVIQVQGASQTCNVPMSTVTVNIPSIPGVMVRLSAGGSASLSASGVTGQAVFAVFQNQEFRLSVTKDAMAHKADISCGTEAVVYDVPVCRIIANFPGMKASLLEAKFGGERVASKRNISDTGDLYVFQNTPYDVSLEIGGNAFSYQGLDCRVNELVLGDATLTVSFPRVKSVNAVRLVGGKTYSQAYKDNSATFSVPNGVYQLLVREGGMEHTATAYVVASSVYNVPMTTLMVNFAGVCAQNVAVLVDGGVVMDTGWCGNTKTFAVFDGQTYGVRVRRYAMEHNGTGIAVSGDRTYRVPFTNLTVSFPRRVRRHGGSRQGRNGVWQGDRRGRQRPDQVLQGQRIRPERRPGRQDPHTVHCTLDSRTYSVPLGDLGITAAREPALITRLITDRLGIRVSTLVSLLARLLHSLL